MDLGTIATQLKDLGTVLSALAKLFSVEDNGGFYDVVTTIGKLFGGEGSSFDGSSFDGSSDAFSGSSDSASATTTASAK